MSSKRKQSSLQIGDQFRDEVAAFLRASGYNTTTEVLMMGKKVDLVTVGRHLGREEKFIIECKYHNRSLDRKSVTQIYADYSTMLDRGDADQVWIIGKRDLPPAAKEFIAAKRNARYFTYRSLQDSVIDFSGYLRSIQQSYTEDGLDQYYIKPRTVAGTNVVHEIEQWVRGDKNAPIAVLAGYGKGKTALTRHLAASCQPSAGG